MRAFVHLIEERQQALHLNMLKEKHESSTKAWEPTSSVPAIRKRQMAALQRAGALPPPRLAVGQENAEVYWVQSQSAPEQGDTNKAPRPNTQLHNKSKQPSPP